MKILNIKKGIIKENFDDFENIDDFFDNIEDFYSNDIEQSIKDKDLIRDKLIEDIHKEMKLLGISERMYEIEELIDSFGVHVKGSIWIPSRNISKFNVNILSVENDVNITKNRFRSLSSLPKVIKGNLFCNYNFIKNFDDAPYVKGIVEAYKQREKTDYPLTYEKYLEIREHVKNLKENKVYIPKLGQIGYLKDLNESKNKGTVLLKDGKIARLSLEDIEVYSLETLNKLMKD